MLLSEQHCYRRITPLAYHSEQARLIASPKRIKVIAAGRRSGKTEIMKRVVAQAAIAESQWDDAWFVLAAPTHAQAKRIFWKDLKLMIPWYLRSGKPSESELTVYLYNGASVTVLGLDKPERIEGTPLNGIGVTESANLKPDSYTDHISPMLVERDGWIWLEGAPEGRNHFYDWFTEARADETGEMDAFHWTAEEILPLYLGEKRAARELALARARMDERTYKQEMCASFEDYSGRAYYAWDTTANTAKDLPYHPADPLIFCFDFNVEPGVAVVCQDDENMTRCINEVYIPRNSNTLIVCDKLLSMYGDHPGDVYLYGDATGGARGSAKVHGSDWDLVKAKMRPHFGERLKIRVSGANPPERVRVNAVNSRVKTIDGTVKLMVDVKRCPNLVRDFEGVLTLEGGSGEIDKKLDSRLTHLTDGLGYFIVRKYPIKQTITTFSGQRKDAA